MELSLVNIDEGSVTLEIQLHMTTPKSIPARIFQNFKIPKDAKVDTSIPTWKVGRPSVEVIANRW